MWSNKTSFRFFTYFTFSGAVVLLLITSCDPAKVLVITASNQPGVSVTLYGNTTMLPFQGEMPPEKIAITVPGGTPVKRDTLIYYGFGGWSGDDKIKNLAHSIDSIIINSSNGQIVLNTHESITNYLLKQRHGFAKRILRIEAK